MRSRRSWGRTASPGEAWVSATRPPASLAPAPQAVRRGRRGTKKRCWGEGRRGARASLRRHLQKGLEIPKRLWKVSGRKCNNYNPNRGQLFHLCSLRHWVNFVQGVLSKAAEEARAASTPEAESSPGAGDVPSNSTGLVPGFKVNTVPGSPHSRPEVQHSPG